MPKLLALLLALVSAPAPRPAEAAPRPAPALLRALLLAPAGSVTLDGPDSRRQLLVTGVYTDGGRRDLTRAARFEVLPARTAAVDPAGGLAPLREGTSTVRAVSGSLRSAPLRVVTRGLRSERPVSFTQEVVPVLARLGCSRGPCHGRADGQGGLKLSLLGFEPEEDRAPLSPESGRVRSAAPGESLLLRKATGAAPHGGGRRLEAGSPAYRLLARWIRQGARTDEARTPEVRRIEVVPGNRVVAPGGRQQLAVLARRSDGSVVDVTAWTQFESGADEMAAVSEDGLVRAGRLPGAAAVMARYQAHVGVFRALVPLGARVPPLPAPRGAIDALVFRQWRRLGLPPSPPCDDPTWIRRATLDLTGRLPTPAELEAFVREREAERRVPGASRADERLVDRLLDDPGCADTFAGKWSALLRNRRGSPGEDPAPTRAFHAWIRDGLRENRPYDRMVRELLTATGEPESSPPVVWYREVRDLPSQVEDTAQLFLGQRLACARCHHHPQERWSQGDYYGLAAFFSRLEVKVPPPGTGKKPRPGEAAPPPPPAVRVAWQPGEASAAHPRTGRPVPPTALAGPALSLPAGADARVRLAQWMTATGNPFFARALVNRYWKHVFGRGLVEPEDDLRATNPAANPELLDALARQFEVGGFDLKRLLRALCTSYAYRLSSLPNAWNAGDRQSFSRFLPRRLPAEVLLDAIDDVAGTRTPFAGAPAGTRAVQLPDNQPESYFLGVFGRPDFASACECERGTGASLAQSLHMLNSPEVLARAAGPRARQLAADPRPHAERVRGLYLLALAREPSPAELSLLLPRLTRTGDPRPAYEDLVWALINSREFLFNH